MRTKYELKSIKAILDYSKVTRMTIILVSSLSSLNFREYFRETGSMRHPSGIFPVSVYRNGLISR